MAGAVNLIVVHMQDFTEIQTRIENVHIGIAAFKNICDVEILGRYPKFETKKFSPNAV